MELELQKKTAECEELKEKNAKLEVDNRAYEEAWRHMIADPTGHKYYHSIRPVKPPPPPALDPPPPPSLEPLLTQSFETLLIPPFEPLLTPLELAPHLPIEPPSGEQHSADHPSSAQTEEAKGKAKEVVCSAQPIAGDDGGELASARKRIRELEDEVERLKPLAEAGKSVRVRLMEYPVHASKQNAEWIFMGNEAAHGGRPLADAIIVTTDADHAPKEKQYWKWYGAKPKLVLDMKNHQRFVDILEWRASVSNFLGDGNYKPSKFHEIFLEAINPSPLERHSKLYESNDPVDTIALGNYVDNDLAFIVVHQRMQHEFRIQAADWKKKNDLEKRLQKQLREKQKKEKEEYHRGRKQISSRINKRMEKMREVDERTQYEMEASHNKRRRTGEHYPQDRYL